MFPDVYTDNAGDNLTIYHRATAAWLWSRRSGVISGLTAASLHGAKYVEDSLPIELVWSNRRPPPGIITNSGQLYDDIVVRGGLPTTSVIRTAHDVGRRNVGRPGALCDAVARLDALGNATGFSAAALRTFATDRHGGARGIRQLLSALDLYDAGSQSPQETRLRLLIIRAGYPRPTTQIPVSSADGRRQYFLDMGWEKHKLAVEYDGDHHRRDPGQFAHDIIRSEDLDELSWTRIRVVKRHRDVDVLQRLAREWARTGDPPGIDALTAHSMNSRTLPPARQADGRTTPLPPRPRRRRPPPRCGRAAGDGLRTRSRRASPS